MKETLSTLKNTSILSFILLCLFFVIAFATTSISNANTDDLVELSKNDADYKIVSEKLNKIEYFRNANINTDSFDNLEYLKFIFDNLDKKDYKTKKYTPTKIICEVNKNVTFVSGKSCNVLVISNKKIDEYKNILFKYEKDLEYVDFEYKGYECQNDGKSYYCLIKKYTEKEEYKGYSLIDKVYKTNNKIIVYEYYLAYENEYEDCIKYYSESYCVDDFEGELPKIEENKIREYGVYFRHEFIKEEDNIYLDESFIVNN